MFDAQTMT